MGRRHPRAPTSAEVKRIARDLQSFLTRDIVVGKRRSRRRSQSIDQISAPVCRFAVERLRQRARRAERVIAKMVWRDLERNLSDRLTFVIGPMVRFYLRAMQALASSSPQRPPSGIDINPHDIFAEFPGSLETVARLILAWAEAQTELLARVTRDRNKISSRFFGGKRASRVCRLRAGLSDPHDGGRTVTMVQFADSNRVVYKPRRCDGELLWFAALQWLDRNGLCVSFQVPKILQRKNCGWVEFLPQKACKNLREVRLFYFRWGAQAALAQILGATDLHRENWLAIGPQPILVDAELIAGEKSRTLTALLETGLVPLTARDGAGFYRGIAPFDSALLRAAPVDCWPTCNGARQAPRKYVNHLVRGFEAVAEIFAKRDRAREFFDKIILPLSQTTNRRVLFRASAEYARVLRESLKPSQMVSVGDRWRRLTRECCASAPNRRIGLAEARALLRCDIPKFMTPRGPLSSWRGFLAGIAELKRSPRLLRRRVLLRNHVRRA
jgi:lantibiotic modifying enzyme